MSPWVILAVGFVVGTIVGTVGAMTYAWWRFFQEWSD